MKPNQDPIDELVEKLRAHRLPYREGAWEEFKSYSQNKRKSKRIWPYAVAAAIIGLGFMLFVLFPSKEEARQPVLVNAPLVEELPLQKHQGLKTEDSLPENSLLQAQAMSESSESSRSPQRDEKIEPPPAALNREPVALEKFSPKVSFVLPVTELTERDLAVRTSPSTLEQQVAGLRTPETTQASDFLTALLKAEKEEMQANAPQSYSIPSKWSFGIEVSPNMSSRHQVNMGGGVALSYAVSNKISVSSGISYMQVDAERGVRAPKVHAMESPATGYVSINVENKTLRKFQANLAGIDIPLNINYHINSRVFTSVGVSLFNVVKEEGTNQFINEQATMSIREGSKSPEPVVKRFMTKEAAEKKYEGKSMNSFFNMSVGYKVPVSKRITLGVEPFYKIPLGSISPDELNLSTGGVKISTRF